MIKFKKLMKNENRGYTVVQLLLVIAIFSAFTVMLLNVSKSAIQQSDFSSAVNNFVSDFSYAKQYAIKENCFVLFDFDADGQSYTIRTLASGEETDEWDVILRERNVKPIKGQQFFNGSTVRSFVLNSLGEVLSFPMKSNKQPVLIKLTFFKRNGDIDTADFQKTVNIFPSGGIKIEK